MQTNNKFLSKDVSTLSLYDMKAKKKTIPIKIFHKIPLTYQENLELQFVHRSNNISIHKNQQKNIKILNNNRYSRKKLLQSINKLANQKKLNYSFNPSQYSIRKIIKKCDKLIHKVLTCKTIIKEQKINQKSYKNAQNTYDYWSYRGLNVF